MDAYVVMWNVNRRWVVVVNGHSGHKNAMSTNVQVADAPSPGMTPFMADHVRV